MHILNKKWMRYASNTLLVVFFIFSNYINCSHGKEPKKAIVYGIDEIRLLYRPFGANYLVGLGPLEIIRSADKGQGLVNSVRIRDFGLVAQLSTKLALSSAHIQRQDRDIRSEKRPADLVIIFVVGSGDHVILSISHDERVEWINYTGGVPDSEQVAELLDLLPSRDLRQFLPTHEKMAKLFEDKKPKQ